MYYQNKITAILESRNIEANPRHVEAWMRSEYSPFDHISATKFTKAVIDAATSIAALGDAFGEKLAQSYGI